VLSDENGQNHAFSHHSTSRIATVGTPFWAFPPVQKMDGILAVHTLTLNMSQNKKYVRKIKKFMYMGFYENWGKIS